jgi:transcriptional regulator NrdR family protein
MVKYRIYYEDGSYDLIRCPECDSEETSMAEGDDMRARICTQCKIRFQIEEQEKKIVKVLSEADPDYERTPVVSGGSVEDLEEYKERARRLRKEIRE